LREIEEIRQRHPFILSNRDFFNTVRLSMLMPRDDFTALLEALAKELRGEVSGNGAVESDVFPIPILVSGYGCESLDLFTFIDEAGGLVTADDLIVGGRSFAQDAPEGNNPLERIADRLLTMAPTPFYLGGKSREAHLRSLVEKSGAKGVVFFQLKFNETFNYDYPNLRDALRDEGIPTHLIETDLRMAAPARIRTGLEAFFEMIRGI
jgi:benzoyl-CoA reductase/2-hydroxyglutaryl-CoA dehydratase subunit BcrC/BadD/HgdB